MNKRTLTVASPQEIYTLQIVCNAHSDPQPSGQQTCHPLHLFSHGFSVVFSGIRGLASSTIMAFSYQSLSGSQLLTTCHSLRKLYFELHLQSHNVENVLDDQSSNLPSRPSCYPLYVACGALQAIN